MHVYSRFTGTIYFDDLTVENLTITTLNDEDNGVLPKTLELGNNYPNPFNPSTTIEYAVPQSENVTIAIYNMVGQRVKTLVKSMHSAGRYKVVWDGKDNRNSNVSSGIYFYNITVGSVSIVKKMVLLK
jgi:FlgD Ig-like domain